MASAVRRYGTKHIVQMRKLTLFYSPKGGSSKGCREFINKNFVQFASERPSSVFTATTIPDTRHPHFLVEFLNGRGYKVDLKNLSDKEVLDHALVLSTSSGKKPKKLQQPVSTRNSSIQGNWTPFLADPMHLSQPPPETTSE